VYSLRLANNDEMAAISELLESRKHIFGDALQNANNLFRVHLLTGEQPGLITDAGVSEEADWDEFLAPPSSGDSGSSTEYSNASSDS
jgi:hypothetical protein